ncbi:MAG: GNAT family N-acetyltransferase [bacterium]|nr:GNAT family N-acetyltransferase [bacterium]
MLNRLYELFELLPPAARRRLRGGLKPTVGRLQHLAMIWQDRRLPVSVIRRPEAAVAFVGHGAVVSYLIKRMYGDYLRPEPAGTIPRKELEARLAALAGEMDFVILSLSEGGGRKAPGGDGLAAQGVVIPQFVRQLRDSPPAGADPRESVKNHTNKNDLNKIRRNNYTYAVTHDANQLASFYHRCHVPYITERHGDAAYLSPFGSFRRQFEEGELLIVMDSAGRTVAGVLAQRKGDTYCALSNGVLDADAGLVNDGVLAAQYYYSIVEAARRGCRRIDFGRSRPFLDDGILFFKKKWGARIEPNSDVMRPLRLFVCNDGPRTRCWLEANPFITQRGGALEGVLVFGDHVDLDDGQLRSRLKQCMHDGLAGLVAVLLTSAWAARRGTLARIAQEARLPLRVVDLSAAGGPLAARHIEPTIPPPESAPLPRAAVKRVAE